MSTINRRQFIERTVITAAGAALLKAQTVEAAQSGMWVSFAPWAAPGNVQWPEQARLAARAGYKGVDWAFGSAKQAGVDATKALLAELKIQPSATNIPFNGPFTGDDAAFKAKLPQLDEDAAFAKAIGCRAFITTLGTTVPAGQTREERWSFMRDRLAAISQVIAKHDVHFGLEFLGPLTFRTRAAGGGGRRGGGAAAPAPGAAGAATLPVAPATPPPPPAPPTVFIYNLPETVKLATEAGPNIGAVLDAWHWYHSGGTVDDILKTDKSRIVHVHISDAKPMAPEAVQDNMRWLAGEGVIDLVGFLQALKKVGYAGGVTTETIGDRLANLTPDEAAKQAADAAIAVMKKAGVL